MFVYKRQSENKNKHKCYNIPTALLSNIVLWHQMFYNQRGEVYMSNITFGISEKATVSSLKHVKMSCENELLGSWGIIMNKNNNLNKLPKK